MNRVKVAIVGLGSWGECHIEACQSIPHVEIAAICDVRKERLHEVGDQYGITERYVDSEQLMKRDDIDLVTVATYEENHLQPTLQALNSGKHVLVEKPISTDAAEAKEMLNTAKRNDRYVIPGHLLRFEPRYAEIYHVIHSGAIGKPESMYFKRARTKGMFQIYNRSHTAFLSTVHDIDLAIWYAGSQVKSVRAYERSISGANSPEILWACLEFKNGTIAFLHSNWMTPDEAGIIMNDSVEVIGGEGIAHFENHGTGLQLWNESGRQTPDLTVHHMMNGVATGALREQLQYICNCIRTGEPPSYISFEDAIHGIEVTNAIIQSAREGVEIELIQKQ